MAINVLSDSLKGGNKTAEISAPKGKDVADSPGNAAEAFAAVLGGALHKNVKAKGQNSSAAVPNTKEKQDPGDSSAQSQTLSDRLMGYGILSFPFAAQLMLQSDPAGKEADSGSEASQGMGNEVSPQLGMTMAKSQGNSLSNSELDNYKQVIADLLEKLSGEITDISEKGTFPNSENLGSKNFSQDFVKLIQGWLTAPGDGVQETQGSFASMAAEYGKPPSSSVDLNTFSQGVLNLLLSEEDKATQNVLLPTKVDGSASGPDKNNPASNTKTFGQTFLNSLFHSGDEGPKDTALLAKAKGTFSQELIKEEGAKSSEASDNNNVANKQNPSLNIGLSNNIAAANVTDGKTAAVPVYQQISAAISEQVMNKSQDLKKLDIQLQPADLGKIQIDLRWENGQVHLQVQASQAATGQLLQNQLPDLRQALANQGINCGMLQMGLGGDRQQNSQGNESSKSRQQKADSSEDEGLAAIHNISSLAEDGINQINVTA